MQKKDAALTFARQCAEDSDQSSNVPQAPAMTPTEGEFKSGQFVAGKDLIVWLHPLMSYRHDTLLHWIIWDTSTLAW